MRKLEYIHFRQQLIKQAKRIPIDTYIEVTYRCNLQCLQCYNPVNRLEGKELSASEIIRFIDMLSDKGCLWLNFTGGEPFIRQDFFEFYRYAVAKGLICCIQSNGTLITKDIARQLADSPPYSIDITVYGASSQTYKSLTGVEKGFDACLEGVDNLLRAGVKPFLKTTVTKQNMHDVRAIKMLAREKGLEYSCDPHIHPRIDGDKSPHQLRLSPQEAAEIIFDDERRYKDWQEYLNLHLNEPNPQDLVACGALEDGFWLDPYGRLRICAIVPKPTYDIRSSGTMDEAWDMFAKYIKAQKPKKENACLSCRLFSICGHCIGWSELEHDDWNRKVDYLCEIAQLQEKKLKELRIWPQEENTYDKTEKNVCKA